MQPAMQRCKTCCGRRRGTFTPCLQATKRLNTSVLIGLQRNGGSLYHRQVRSVALIQTVGSRHNYQIAETALMFIQILYNFSWKLLVDVAQGQRLV